jgi:hypothetical protein
MTTISNESGLEPTGQAILCVPYLPELTKSVLHTPDQVMALELMREMRATVIELGEMAFKFIAPDGTIVQLPRRCEPGDNVLISKFAGVIVKGPLDGKIYRLCNHDDVICRLRGDLSQMMLKDPVAQSKQQGGEGRSQAKILQARS